MPVAPCMRPISFSLACRLRRSSLAGYRDIVPPRDYIVIPANMLHVAVNRGVYPAVFIGSRNEATAQESVVLHPEMDQKVP